MNPKLILCLALVLSGAFLASRMAEAQNQGGTVYMSLETRIAIAPVVFRGTITNVSETVIHTNNQFGQHNLTHPDNQAPLPLYDIHSYSITLKIDEVLKGQLAPNPLEFTINKAQKWGQLEKWADERVSFLGFSTNCETSIESEFFGLENFIFLGPTLPGRTDDTGFKKNGLRYDVHDMDLTCLANPEDILARARKFAEKWADTTNFHLIDLPARPNSKWVDFNALSVPVVTSLEKIATGMISAPEDFISANKETDLVNGNRGWLRVEGISALRYFKSDKNIQLLKTLLDAPDFDVYSNGRYYYVRNEAYEVLKGWGVDVPKPVTHEVIPENQTKQ